MQILIASWPTLMVDAWVDRLIGKETAKFDGAGVAPLPVLTTIGKTEVCAVTMPTSNLVPPPFLFIINSPAQGAKPAFLKKNNLLACVANLRSSFKRFKGGTVYLPMTIHRVNYGVCCHFSADACRALIEFYVLTIWKQIPVFNPLYSFIYYVGRFPVHPRVFDIRVSICIHAHNFAVVIVGIQNPGKGQLLKIDKTNCTFALFSGPIQWRQKNPHHNRYYWYDYQQFDKSESLCFNCSPLCNFTFLQPESSIYNTQHCCYVPERINCVVRPCIIPNRPYKYNPLPLPVSKSVYKVLWNRSIVLIRPGVLPWFRSMAASQ